MTDLRTLLDRTAGPADGPVPAPTVEADLLRGRRALRRHRLRTRGTRTLLVAAAVGVVAVGGTAALDGGTGDPSSSPTAAGTTAATSAALALTAYEGSQPAGFEVSTAPQDWVVRSSDPVSFVLAPPGVASQAPVPGAVSYVDAVAVSLSADAQPDFTASTLTVAGQRALLEPARDGTRTLYLEQAGSAVLTVQVWAGLPLTDQQVLDLAAGITVTAAAQPAFG